MAQYKELRQTFLEDVLSTEAFPSAPCQLCRLSPGVLRCRTCQSPQSLCKTCFCSSHQRDPWHHPEILSGNHLKRTSLLEIGFVLHLGHGGNPCPHSIQVPGQNAQTEEVDSWEDVGNEELNPLGAHTAYGSATCPCPGVKMTLVDSNGVFILPVQECLCPGASPRWRQLLQARLFPASTKRPLTAFSFRLLDLFEILHVECKISVMSCFKMLQRLTNEAFPHLVPVSSMLIIHLYTAQCFIEPL
jgi:hypothetical protein